MLKNWNRFVTLGGILLALSVCAAGVLLASQLPVMAQEYDVPQVTILPASTYTPTAPPPAAEPTASAAAQYGGNGIGIGVYVQITGTQGEGLRIRQDPGLDTNVNFYGMDYEVFLVEDGPVDADGYTWWHITAPYDDTRSGWSAANYLTIIEE